MRKLPGADCPGIVGWFSLQCRSVTQEWSTRHLFVLCRVLHHFLHVRTAVSSCCSFGWSHPVPAGDVCVCGGGSVSSLLLLLIVFGVDSFHGAGARSSYQIASTSDWARQCCGGLAANNEQSKRVSHRILLLLLHGRPAAPLVVFVCAHVVH